MTGFEICTLALLLAIFYTYAGYPLLLWGLSYIYNDPIRRAEYAPAVSLIISAYNEEAVIASKIVNALATDYPEKNLEIIVITDGSTDQTTEIACSFKEQSIKVLHSSKRQGKSAAMNRAVAHATGAIIVFSDANALYRPEAIRRLVRNFADPLVGCVSGSKTVVSSGTCIGQSEGIYWKYESFIRRKETETGSTTGVVGEINAIRRTLFNLIPQSIINDDTFLALSVLKAGYRVAFEPDAISWETSAASISDEIVRRQRINAGRYQQLFKPSLWWNIAPFNLFKLFSHKYLRLLLPFFMIAALAMNASIILQGSPPLIFVLTFWLQATVYGLAAIGLKQEWFGVGSRLTNTAFYIVSSNFAALKGFQRFLSGQQTVLWAKADRSR